MNRNSLVWLLRNIWQSWLSRVDCLVQSSGCKNKLNSELQQIRWVCLLQTSCKMYPVISFVSFLISTMRTLFFIWSQFMRNQCFAESQVNFSGTKKNGTSSFEWRSFIKLAVLVPEAQANSSGTREWNC